MRLRSADPAGKHLKQSWWPACIEHVGPGPRQGLCDCILRHLLVVVNTAFGVQAAVHR